MDEPYAQIEALIAEIERQRLELRETQTRLQASLSILQATITRTRHTVVTFYTSIGEADAYFTPRLTPYQYEQVLSLVGESFDTPAEVLCLLQEVTPIWNVDVIITSCL